MVEVTVESEAGIDQLFCQFLEGLKLDFQARRAPECDQDTRGKPLDSLASHLLGGGHRKKGTRWPGQGNVRRDEGPGQTFPPFEFPAGVVHLIFEPGRQAGAVYSPAAANHFGFKPFH